MKCSVSRTNNGVGLTARIGMDASVCNRYVGHEAKEATAYFRMFVYGAKNARAAPGQTFAANGSRPCSTELKPTACCRLGDNQAENTSRGVSELPPPGCTVILYKAPMRSTNATPGPAF